MNKLSGYLSCGALQNLKSENFSTDCLVFYCGDSVLQYIAVSCVT